MSYTEISIKGKTIRFPCIIVNDLTIVIRGKWLKVAFIKDEEWIEPIDDVDPNIIINDLNRNNLKVDILVFSQRLPNTEPKFNYFFEWKNLAVIHIKGFKEWWDNLPQVTRKNVRRSERRGVLIRTAAFDDDLINGIVRINNSAPIRQRFRFTHYGKEFHQVRKDYSEFTERSEYIGAYFQDELIGFLRLVYMGKGKIASIMQLLCMPQHYDKRPANALIAKAVDMCAKKGVEYIVYGQLYYHRNVWAPLAEFKRRNGFCEVNIPVYYVPLSVKGRVAIFIGLHRGLRYLVPKTGIKLYYWLRKIFFEKISRPVRKEEED